MKCYFESCSQAIKNTLENKSYGLYYAEKAKKNQEIHVHDCCEVFLCLTNGNHFLIDGKLYSADENDLFIISHVQSHKVLPNNLNDFKRYSLHIHPSFITKNSTSTTNLSKCFFNENKVNKIKISEHDASNLIHIFKKLEKSYDFGDDIYKNSHVIDVLLTVNELCSVDGTEIKIDNSSLQLAIDYINGNFDKDLSLACIAKNAYVSVNKLCSLFKENLNTTVIKFLTSRRLTNAKKMLESGCTLTETALASGFNDYANFIRVFKTAVGISPGKYAKQHKEKI